MSLPANPNGETSSILRLPTSIRLYIFGLSGLGGKLLPYSEAPWTSLCFETRHWEAKIRHSGRHVPNTSLSVEEQRDVWKRLRRASHEQAFKHSLYKVSRQVRQEAQCALVKYNIIMLVAETKSIADYERWEPERLRSLRDVVILPVDEESETEKLGSLLRRSCEFSRLRIHIQAGLHYAILWEEALERSEPLESEEDYEMLAKSYHIFEGCKDFFVYYASRFYLETKHEKMIMGQNYDAEARGKLNPDLRDYQEPWCKADPPQPMIRY